MSDPYSISKKYVFRKLSTVRWKPALSNFSKAETFVSGSWDDQVIIIKLLCFIMQYLISLYVFF